MVLHKFYKSIGALIPARLRLYYENELKYLDFDVDSLKLIGFIFSFAFLLAIATALNLFIFFSVNVLIGFSVSFSLFLFVSYVWLSLSAESKAKQVDDIMPDALQLMASNIRAGLTTEKALFEAARPDFGPLEAELQSAANRISTGSTVEEALLIIPKRIKSRSLERSINLIVEGIRSGGELGELLVQIATDLREQKAIQDDIVANVSLYTLLILFAAVVGAPALFAISTFIVQILQSQTFNVQVPTATLERLSASGSGISGALLGGTDAGISGDFVLFYSLVALFVSSLFASLTIGIISGGTEKDGLKYFPGIVLVSFILFFIMRALLLSAFSQLL